VKTEKNKGQGYIQHDQIGYAKEKTLSYARLVLAV